MRVLMAALTLAENRSECCVMSCDMADPQCTARLPRPAHGIVVESYNFVKDARESDMLGYVLHTPVSVGVNAVSWQDYIGRGTGWAGQVVGGALSIWCIGYCRWSHPVPLLLGWAGPCSGHRWIQPHR